MSAQEGKQMVEAMITAEPLEGIDAVIERSGVADFASEDSEHFRKLLLRYMLAIAGEVSEGINLEEALSDVIDRELKTEKGRLIAACCLRLLPKATARWLWENPWRLKVVSLFDYQLQVLYRDRKIPVDSMAHEKLERLATVAIEFERYLLEALSMLTSLERIDAQQQKLMRALGNKPAQSFIVPFLPDDFEAQLGEAYKRAELYVDKRDDVGADVEFENASREIEKIAEKFNSKRTQYSTWLAEQVARKLLFLIREDFARNPTAQPADIQIETRDNKKYPLHVVGQTINLGFIVINQGSGYSHDTTLSILSDDNLRLLMQEVQVGRLAPSSSYLVEIPAETVHAAQSVDLVVQVDWRNFDLTRRGSTFSFVAQAQKAAIDWETLKQSDPYSLEPVTTEQELVGRKDLLDRLLGSLKAKSIGSSIIRGQKRVGKTSVAKAIQSHLEGENYITVYLEPGDYIVPDPAATVRGLGNRISKELISREERIGHLNPPQFDDALSPLAEFLDDVVKIVPDRRFVFILDEFDEIPLDLYASGAVGDSFFLTLRSISSRPTIGFVLVGGEKMAHVLDCQGDKLNKWKVERVDYFTRESDWADYKELVQRPVGDELEYTDNALFALHDVTAGNPYFTKLVCQHVFGEAAKRRDCHITRTEVKEAVDLAIRGTDVNTFQHFWTDGIFERGPRAAEKSIRRRKILIAVADVLVRECPASKLRIVEHPLAKEIPALDSDLKEFVTRRVLVSNSQDETYDFKVPLFFKWLKERGVAEVIVTFSDLDAALRERQKEEESKVRADEVQSLLKRWQPGYKGQVISEDRVRAWLDQFGGIREQRAMFALLKGLRFYSDGFLRKKMAEIHDIIKREQIVHRVEQRRLKRSDILISYLDNPGKSGAHLARLYADEAGVYVENVIEKGKLTERLQKPDEIQALLFLDDFVGTGNAASEYLMQIDSSLSEVVQSRDIKLFFASILAFINGWSHIQQIVTGLQTKIRVHACEILDDTARCFSNDSTIFTDPNERAFAKKIAHTYGLLLEKHCPLGYGNLEMAVVFERGCPNNSLPILWSESAAHKWTPLFKRL